MPPTIRCARPGDLHHLLRLYAQLADEDLSEPSAALSDSLAAMLAAPWLELLVAEVGGAVVGTVELVFVPNITHGGQPWAQLENMVVDASGRGSGIGRALLDHCAALAKQRGCYKIQLQSADRRTAAHRFYEANGYAASSKGYRLYFD